MPIGFRDKHFYLVITSDAILICLAYYVAYWIRFDGDISSMEMGLFWGSLGWIVLLKIVIFFLMNLYRGMWRYTGLPDILNIIKANGLCLSLITLIIVIAYRFQGFSRGVILIDSVLATVFISGFRIVIRSYVLGYLKINNPLQNHRRQSMVSRILIVGAGDTGEKLLREINQNQNLYLEVVGFIDDNPFKQNHSIHGVRVLGNRNEIPEIVDRYQVDEIIIAIPTATAQQMRQVINFCESTKIPFKSVPGIDELINGEVTMDSIRDVRYEDLLGREPVCLENDEICQYISGKRVMVTGAGGSIGSELCRQIAAYSPSQLILLDRNESGLYELNLDLVAKFSELNTVEVLAATQNKIRMEHVFRVYHPQVVFHAAAYKHVPMMEMHPWEAVYNNIVGSMVLLEMCRNYHVERCVVISTDKAVRPTNVMGASKRLMEMMAQSYAEMNGVRYMAVRFGNVLGSVGSVLPLFKKQIARGGPVTVTHPDVTRYFMTIPEAVSLVLQAGGLGKGSEIFVLKMGTPVRIADMARDLITLSGFIPDEEIKIEFSGLRPGEKLYEELITEGENILHTRRKDIMVLRNTEPMSIETMGQHIEDLVELAQAGDAKGIMEKLKSVIPEYNPQIGKCRSCKNTC
jgi:FlaA1/EpsC-like NDP-sugar epimerase